MVIDVGDLDGFQQRGGCSPRLILSLIHQHLLYLACLSKKSVGHFGMSCKSFVSCCLGEEKKSVRLIVMSCASWLCILPVCAKRCQTYVHHGSVSCLFVHTHKKSVRLIGMSYASWLCILPVCAKKCQTYWNVMYIMALYLACL